MSGAIPGRRPAGLRPPSTAPVLADTHPAAVLNPLAGYHPVTADPVEVEAAVRAAEASIAEFPYFHHRYGDRARMFGASDGGWLLTLPRSSTAVVHEQVLWLGSVLASRGMPRLLLERHLELLHRELRRLLADEPDRHHALLDAAALLAERRRRHLADDDLSVLREQFDEAVRRAEIDAVPGMGAILAAAVADEADGLGSAVPSVLEWAMDPALFPSGWVQAVGITVEEARARVRTAAGGA